MLNTVFKKMLLISGEEALALSLFASIVVQWTGEVGPLGDTNLDLHFPRKTVLIWKPPDVDHANQSQKKKIPKSLADALQLPICQQNYDNISVTVV